MTLDLVALVDMVNFYGEKERRGEGVGCCRIDRGNWSLSL